MNMMHEKVMEFYNALPLFMDLHFDRKWGIQNDPATQQITIAVYHETIDGQTFIKTFPITRDYITNSNKSVDELIEDVINGLKLEG